MGSLEAWFLEAGSSAAPFSAVGVEEDGAGGADSEGTVDEGSPELVVGTGADADADADADAEAEAEAGAEDSDEDAIATDCRKWATCRFG